MDVFSAYLVKAAPIHLVCADVDKLLHSGFVSGTYQNVSAVDINIGKLKGTYK